MINNTIDAIIRYEQGETTPRETLELFSELVKSGTAWILQGGYGRSARIMISQGLLDESGEITEYGRDFVEDVEEGVAEGEEQDLLREIHAKEVALLVRDLLEAKWADEDGVQIILEGTRVRLVHDVTVSLFTVDSAEDHPNWIVEETTHADDPWGDAFHYDYESLCDFAFIHQA